jgi:hypothetical protein
MRRTVSIVMMSLASMMILAHSIVPHHHHHQIPVAVVHLHDGSVDAHSDASAHTHHHGEADEDCLMSDVLGGAVLRMLDSDSSLVVQEGLSEPLYPILAFAIVSSALLDVEPECDIGLPFRRRPYPSNHYVDVVVRTSGLRAPPVC